MRPLTSSERTSWPEVVENESRINAVRMRDPFLNQPLQLTRYAAAVFVFEAGFTQHRPDVLPRVMAYEHRQQLVRIQSVGLSATGSAIDFDAGRIHDDVVHAQLSEPAMQPPPIAARF